MRIRFQWVDFNSKVEKHTKQKRKFNHHNHNIKCHWIRKLDGGENFLLLPQMNEKNKEIHISLSVVIWRQKNKKMKTQFHLKSLYNNHVDTHTHTHLFKFCAWISSANGDRKKSSIDFIGFFHSKPHKHITENVHACKHFLTKIKYCWTFQNEKKKQKQKNTNRTTVKWTIKIFL